MARSTPRGHTEASREILMCVTGRTSREAVHDSGLIQREGPAHIGCSGDCADQGECNCSHSKAWQAPRQPRLPEPRTPHLPLWTRIKLEWQHQRVRVLLSIAFLISMGLTLAGVAALTFFR